jgi:NADPH-dependent curcumin reductase CurA
VNDEPREENFKYQSCPYPEDLQTDELLIKTLFLSVDPAMVNTKSRKWQTYTCR